MRQTPVNDYLEEISTELPEELYGHLSDAIYETVCEFDEEVAQLKAEADKLRKLCADLRFCKRHDCLTCSHGRFCDMHFDERYAELGIEMGH